MTSKYKEEDLSKIRTISISDRESRVTIEDFVDPESQDVDGRRLERMFPDVLKGSDLRAVVSALAKARESNGEILWLIGAHVIKCGLSYYLSSLIKEGYITALATTGSTTVHDIELAFYGKTSEDVAVELPKGRFGMSEETASHFSAACNLAAGSKMGLGEGIGAYINQSAARYTGVSVYANAYEGSVPATVHVALGTDITHQHPSFPDHQVGELSMRDFRILSRSVGRLFDGGVVVVFGSAVVLPEVFLKAVSIGYNLGKTPRDVTAVNFDMLQQYRVRENVLTRPFQNAGRSYSFSGHHEIMLPLLYHLLRER
ncbi:MAG: hypothetical protein OEN01_11880 [Candidatus Krumholzibacteria bacterium]|nr:hypothetical protein [Candidatus Krumholzibacteria bacterium]